MSDFNVVLEGDKELVKSLKQTESKVLAKEMRRAMRLSLSLLERAITSRTPVNTGGTRGGIATEMRGRSVANFRGRVFSPAIHGLPLEHGRKPGKAPPTDAIEVWVRQKGIGGADSRSTAFVIARAIGRRGTKGAFMFKKGFEASKSKILALWRDIPRRIKESIK